MTSRVQHPRRRDLIEEELFPRHARRITRLLSGLEPDELGGLGRVCREPGTPVEAGS